MRPIQATIHLSALAHNLNIAKAKAPPAKVMAVIKANGYGHGLLNAALGLKAADGFAVLSLDEALAFAVLDISKPFCYLKVCLLRTSFRLLLSIKLASWFIATRKLRCYRTLN